MRKIIFINESYIFKYFYVILIIYTNVQCKGVMALVLQINIYFSNSEKTRARCRCCSKYFRKYSFDFMGFVLQVHTWFFASKIDRSKKITKLLCVKQFLKIFEYI